MSEIDLTGLDELFAYKNRLMNDLLTNEEIVRLLDDDCRIVQDPKKFVYTQVFPFEFTPTVTEHGKTIICCEVDIREVISKTVLAPVIYIWEFTHISKLRLPGGEGVRVDKLASEIVKGLSGSRYYGHGELELQAVKRFSPIKDYQGKVITFITKDWNRPYNSVQQVVPGNRREW